MTKVYTALVTRGEVTWTADIQDLPGYNRAAAMGKDWDSLKRAAQEMCDCILGLPDGTVVVDLKLKDLELQAAVEEVGTAKVVLRSAQHEADMALRRAARRLCRIAPVRDVARILGYSHQHVAKMVPRSALKAAEQTGSTPQDWAKMLYLVAGIKTPASPGELALEASSWLDSFPKDPGFAEEVAAAHRAFIRETAGDA